MPLIFIIISCILLAFIVMITAIDAKNNPSSDCGLFFITDFFEICLIIWLIISNNTPFPDEVDSKTYDIQQSKDGVQFSYVDNEFININSKFGKVVDINKYQLQISVPKCTTAFGISYPKRLYKQYKLITKEIKCKNKSNND